MPTTPVTVLLVGAAPLPEALERLRDQGLLITARTSVEQLPQLLDTLLPDLLLSPQSPQRLPAGVRWLPWHDDTSTLASLLAPWLPALSPTLPVRLGALWVDEARGLLRLPPHEVQLPRTEMRLLLCLGRHGGRALSRQQLLTEVWPADQRPQARTVDQVVRRLRCLLQPLGQAVQLHSLHGLGYRLDLPPFSPV